MDDLDELVEKQVEKYRKACKERQDKVLISREQQVECYKFGTEAQTSEEYIKSLGRNAQLRKHPVRRNNSNHFCYTRDSSALVFRPTSHSTGIKVMMNQFQVVPYFEAVAKSECKQMIQLNQSPMRIGRKIVSSSSIMSKEHVDVFISRSEKRYIIHLMDLNSTNGTFVNGKRLEPFKKHQVNEKDIVSFGPPEAMIQYRINL